MNASPVVNHPFVESDLEAVDQFVARVLRRAHQAAEAEDEMGTARAILDLAHMFADELTVTVPGFDRLAFVEAATERTS
jgi:hypothetical protein